MPTKTLTTPEGDSYSIEAPPGHSDAQIFQVWQQYMQTPEGQALAAQKRRVREVSTQQSPEPLQESPSPAQDGMDWQSAAARLQQGRISDPAQDKLFASTTQPWEWGRTESGKKAGEERNGLLGMRPQWVQDAPSGSAEAVPFGNIADPISQLAFYLAPGIAQWLSKTMSLGGSVAPVAGQASRQSSSEMSEEAIHALKQKFGIGNPMPPSHIPTMQTEKTVATSALPATPGPTRQILDAPSIPIIESPSARAVIPSQRSVISPTPSPVSPTPASAPTAPQGLASVPPESLRIDPNRFQYKLLHNEQGTTGTLADVKTYDPNLAGVIQVWHDPVKDATYVVNGHNRVALARRAQAPTVNVQYIDATSAESARAIGALTNIAQGQGTAIDAAKFFRDTGWTADELREQGISLGQKVAQDGLALSRLNPSLFGAVARGEFPMQRGAIIGSKVPDHTQQHALLRLLDKAQAGSKRLTDATVAELADMATAAPTHTETVMTLFGQESTTASLAVEKAELLAYLRGRLVHEKNLFGKVGQYGAAKELERAGNVINVEQSQGVAQQAQQLLAVFDRLKQRSGPLNDTINEALGKIAGGGNASTIREQLYNRLVTDFPKFIGGGEAATSGTSAGVSGATSSADISLPGF